MQYFIYLFLLLLFPEVAHAGAFDPSPDDTSVKILNQLFGTLVNGGNDPFGDSIKTFNSCLLMVGGVLATYTLLVSTLGTAHDGEMLGKKFSSVWTPIRYSVGTAVVLPVLPHGYCIMSQLVMSLVLQGVGIADSVWSTYMSKPSVGAALSPATTARAQLIKVAEDTLTASICVEAHRRQVEDSPKLLKALVRYDWSMKLEDGTYYFGDQKGLTSYFSKKACGWVKFPAPAKQQVIQKGAPGTNAGYLGPMNDLFTAPDTSVLTDAHKIGTSAMVTAINALAVDAVANNKDVPQNAKKIYGKLIGIVDTYMVGIQAVAKTVASKSNDSSANAKKYGWFLAGTYHNSIIATNNQISAAVNAFPSSSSNYIATSDNDSADADTINYYVADQILAGRGPEYGTRTSVGDTKDKAASSRTEEIGYGGRFAASVIESFAGFSVYDLASDTRGVEITIAELGNRLLSAYWQMTTVMTGLSAIALIPGTAGAVGAALQVFTSMLSLPISALCATAFACAFLLPMMPFIVWLGCIFGWLIQVIIAIIAAPIWAVAHLAEGHDLAGKGSSGYMMVLGLLLRPALLVFGFISSIVVSQVGGELINKVFFQVFSFSQVDGEMGFIKIIGASILYAIIIFSFLKKNVSLMHIIPDEAMKWIGGGADQVGSYAKAMGEGSSGAMAGAAAGVTAARSGMQISPQNAGKIGDALGRLGKKFKGGKGEEGEGGVGPKLNDPSGGKDGKKDGADEKSGEEPPKTLAEVKAASPANVLKKAVEGAIGAFKATDIQKSQAGDNAAKVMKSLDTKDGQAFAKNLEEKAKANPDQAPNKAVASAYNATLDGKFGKGTGSLVAQSSDGYFNKGAETMLEKYKAKHDELKGEVGDQGAKDLIYGANVKSIGEFKNDPSSTKQGGNVGLREFMSKNLDQLKAPAKVEESKPVQEKSDQPVAKEEDKAIVPSEDIKNDDTKK